MKSLTDFHKYLQQMFAEPQISTGVLSQITRETLSVADIDELTLFTSIDRVKDLARQESNIYPYITIELLLVSWTCHYRQMSKRYTLSLLSQTFLSRHRGIHRQFKRPGSQIIRVVQVVTESLWQGQSLGRALAKLTRYRNLSDGLELVSQLIHYQLQFIEAKPEKTVRPLPRKLLVAIRNWPDNDEVFPKVIQALENHPSLSVRLREQATAQTQQHHLLGLKQSLLWLGPERSRELILISHLETHLSWPYFPMREHLLVMRTMLSRLIEAFQNLLSVELPCHPDLLSYLWIYDCWYHPHWTTQVYWAGIVKKSAPPLQPLDWQSFNYDAPLQRSAKLSEYWRLPPRLNRLLETSKGKSRFVSVCQLATMATSIAYESGGEAPNAWKNVLSEHLTKLGISWSEFNEVIHKTTVEFGLYCPYEPIPL